MATTIDGLNQDVNSLAEQFLSSDQNSKYGLVMYQAALAKLLAENVVIYSKVLLEFAGFVEQCKKHALRQECEKGVVLKKIYAWAEVSKAELGQAEQLASTLLAKQWSANALVDIVMELPNDAKVHQFLQDKAVQSTFINHAHTQARLSWWLSIPILGWLIGLFKQPDHALNTERLAKAKQTLAVSADSYNENSHQQWRKSFEAVIPTNVLVKFLRDCQAMLNDRCPPPKRKELSKLQQGLETYLLDSSKGKLLELARLYKLTYPGDTDYEVTKLLNFFDIVFGEYLSANGLRGAVRIAEPNSFLRRRGLGAVKRSEANPDTQRSEANPDTQRSEEANPDTQRSEANPDTQRSEANPDTQRSEANPDTQRSEANPDTQRSEPNPDTQRSEANPDTQRSEPNPDTQRSEANPDTQRSEPNPDTQRSEANPDTQRSEANPDTQRSEANPDTQRSEANPDTQRSEANPDTQRSEANPDTQRSEANPDTQRSEANPDTQRSEANPDTQRSEANPDTQCSEANPDTQCSEANPDTQRSEANPDTQCSEANPDTDTTSSTMMLQQALGASKETRAPKVDPSAIVYSKVLVATPQGSPAALSSSCHSQAASTRFSTSGGDTTPMPSTGGGTTLS